MRRKIPEGVGISQQQRISLRSPVAEASGRCDAESGSLRLHACLCLENCWEFETLIAALPYSCWLSSNALGLSEGDQSEYSSLAGGHSHNMVLILFSATLCPDRDTRSIRSAGLTSLEAPDEPGSWIHRKGWSRYGKVHCIMLRRWVACIGVI